jgi:purine-binding chemotaxis protein CheW
MNQRPKIDWDQARRRLEESRRALEETLAFDPARVQAAYRQRARRLAQPADPLRHVPMVRVLVFRAGGGRYGVELSALSEIVSKPRLARVPGAPPQLAGVIQVRGEIRPVWDFARLIGSAGTADGGGGAVLLVASASGQTGLRVDEVEEILEVRQADLAPPLEDRPHVKWITPELVAIVDPEELLKKEDIG